MSVLTSTSTDTRIFDQEVEELRDDLDRDYSGWFCIRTDPWPCPAQGCSVAQPYVTAAHLIVVWPRKDDRMLLSYANDCQQIGRNPSIVEYERALGHCIAYDVWVRIGRPVHGQLARPADKPWRQL